MNFKTVQHLINEHMSSTKIIGITFTDTQVSLSHFGQNTVDVSCFSHSVSSKPFCFYYNGSKLTFFEDAKTKEGCINYLCELDALEQKINRNFDLQNLVQDIYGVWALLISKLKLLITDVFACPLRYVVCLPTGSDCRLESVVKTSFSTNEMEVIKIVHANSVIGLQFARTVLLRQNVEPKVVACVVTDDFCTTVTVFMCDTFNVIELYSSRLNVGQNVFAALLATFLFHQEVKKDRDTWSQFLINNENPLYSCISAFYEEKLDSVYFKSYEEECIKVERNDIADLFNSEVVKIFQFCDNVIQKALEMLQNLNLTSDDALSQFRNAALDGVKVEFAGAHQNWFVTDQFAGRYTIVAGVTAKNVISEGVGFYVRKMEFKTLPKKEELLLQDFNANVSVQQVVLKNQFYIESCQRRQQVELLNSTLIVPENYIITITSDLLCSFGKSQMKERVTFYDEEGKETVKDVTLCTFDLTQFQTHRSNVFEFDISKVLGVCGRTECYTEMYDESGKYLWMDAIRGDDFGPNKYECEPIIKGVCDTIEDVYNGIVHVRMEEGLISVPEIRDNDEKKRQTLKEVIKKGEETELNASLVLTLKSQIQNKEIDELTKGMSDEERRSLRREVNNIFLKNVKLQDIQNKWNELKRKY
ncbi:hypothetical protein EIN_247080 [Entamoeba invadens IP1]|uniref:Uncharacterized protein n=1 Tax=Entamoeba invadens IP1 TaxID=370355 RepID=A0A0A1UGE0_ENTIV|nr:hypothetical protein EIN_247080 [Entamoeba invadens IP1]ELP94814.1 hypothetical protein EIN_247080 [Entamoeba invadens IP1]|eukprot:XP_004261585.1 hypothetical protein EIN_247080 [Entamoeba invadens IP1]